MAKAKSQESPFWGAMLSAGLYKPTQGRTTRQLTFAVLALVTAYASYTIYTYWRLPGAYAWVPLWTALGVFCLGLWMSFRLVNYSQFADFLVATEAEMKKVTWPTRTELFRGTAVVLVTMFLLAFVLFFYDVIWGLLFQTLGVLESPPEQA